MSQIARIAKVGRQTLYRRFRNKEEVLHSVFEMHALANVESARKLINWQGDLEDVIVATMISSLRLNLSDKLMPRMVREGSSRDAGQFYIGPSSPMQAAAIELWMPVVDKARARHALRAHVSPEEAILHIRAIHYILLIRQDLAEKDWPQFIQRNLLSVLLRDSHNKYAR